MLIFTAVFQQFFCIDILSNTCRYFFRFLHCQNYGCRAVYYITAAENPGSGSHTVRAFTGNNKTTVVDLDTFGSRNDTGCRSLSDSQDNTITGNDFLTAFGYELTVLKVQPDLFRQILPVCGGYCLKHASAFCSDKQWAASEN